MRYVVVCAIGLTIVAISASQILNRVLWTGTHRVTVRIQADANVNLQSIVYQACYAESEAQILMKHPESNENYYVPPHSRSGDSLELCLTSSGESRYGGLVNTYHYSRFIILRYEWVREDAETELTYKLIHLPYVRGHQHVNVILP